MLKITNNVNAEIETFANRYREAAYRRFQLVFLKPRNLNEKVAIKCDLLYSFQANRVG